jgi:DNA-binding MarR family transcriptional regulator
MEILDKCYSIVQQSSAKGGISAKEVGEKLGVHRSTTHGYLNTLEYMGKVESQHGRWLARTGQKTIKPLEKEIVIELPMPKSEWQRMALLENFARDLEEHFPEEKDNMYRISLEKLRETRTIRIKGKNVDELDLQKIANLIQQANEKSPIAYLKGIFKGLKREPLIPSSNSEKAEHTNNNERMSSET